MFETNYNKAEKQTKQNSENRKQSLTVKQWYFCFKKNKSVQIDIFLTLNIGNDGLKVGLKFHKMQWALILACPLLTN